jgi:hypothetical protein
MMRELNYQSSSDRKYERHPALRKLFGPSQAEVWSKLAEAMGARHSHSFWKGERIDVEVGQWTVTLDTFSPDGKIFFTRLRAPYVNRDGFRFVVYRASIFTPLGKMLGMQDISIGQEMFDQSFVVKSTSETQVRKLLADPKLRALLHAQDRIRLDVKDDEGWFGTKFPERVDELRLLVLGIVKDTDRLQTFFELFAYTLNRLCHIGSAYEDDPRIRL